MIIMLGVFGDYFERMETEFGWISYDRFNEFIFPLTGNVIDRVSQACEAADEINFLLDRVMLPLNSKESYTCGELEIILDRDSFLEKTQFWLRGEEVDRDKVLEIMQNVKDDTLMFDHINFNKTNQ